MRLHLLKTGIKVLRAGPYSRFSTKLTFLFVIYLMREPNATVTRQLYENHILRREG